MRQRDRQSGFSIVEALIVVVAIGIISTAGWFVYQHNRVKLTHAATSTQPTNQTANQNSGQQAGTTTAPSNQNIVKIPELGIQITVPDDIKDLKYQVSSVTLKNGNQATLALFSTAALTALDSGCGTSFGPLGSLEKANGQFPSNDQLAAFKYGILVKQFPTFYISAGVPQAACSNNNSANAAAIKFKNEFATAESTIQALN